MMRYILTLFLIFSATYGNACTVCGCSASNQYLGILPQFHKHFVGVQYQHREFRSEHPGHGADAASTFSREYFTTVQVWGRYNMGKRVQLFAFLPFVYNVKTEEGKTSTASGIGDATILANVQLVKRDDLGKDWKHSLQAGGGVKMPTGGYDRDATQTEDGLPNMQPGTNSWDFVLNANYTVRRKSAGLNTDVSYTITTPNASQYKFGNRLSIGASAFYWYQKKNWTLLPQAGLRLDHTGPDFDNYRYSLTNDMTGGTQLYASLGAQTFYKRFGLQLMGHLPLSQHYAKGLVTTTFKTEAGVFLLF